ncbi:MAG: UPF0280 family protein [Desulfohalobiaceae bacterium]
MPDPIHTSSDRRYRMRCSPRQGELVFQVVLEHTDLWVTAQLDCSAEVLSEVRRLRGQIKSFMTTSPEFAVSLVPVEVPASAPELVRRMAGAARQCGVGPMAAVAGAIAQAVADRFAPRSRDIIVENGGDVYLHSTRDRTVGLLSRPGEGLNLGLSLHRREFPLALCASSGRIGHSLSFGRGDLVVVKSRSGAFADAAATTLANRLVTRRDVNAVLGQARQLAPAGLTGVFAQFDDQLGIWGEMELVEL